MQIDGKDLIRTLTSCRGEVAVAFLSSAWVGVSPLEASSETCLGCANCPVVLFTLCCHTMPFPGNKNIQKLLTYNGVHWNTKDVIAHFSQRLRFVLTRCLCAVRIGWILKSFGHGKRCHFSRTLHLLQLQAFLRGHAFLLPVEWELDHVEMQAHWPLGRCALQAFLQACYLPLQPFAASGSSWNCWTHCFDLLHKEGDEMWHEKFDHINCAIMCRAS